MELLFIAPTTNQLLLIAGLILILLVVWTVIRFVLKLASRLFAFGCAAILLLGILLVAYAYFL